MESRSTSDVTSDVLRCIRPLTGPFRYYPYTQGTFSEKEDMKDEVVRLGVELSLYVSQSMFLLCDDIHTMLWFCFKLWRGVLVHRCPVLERLLLVIHYVYCKDIKPKNGVYQEDGGNSVHWELIRATWKDFADGIIILHRLDMVLRNKDSSFDNRMLLSAVEKYKQGTLKKLGDKLRFVEDVSKANGFVRDSMESNIFDLWKPLFDVEATSKVLRSRILNDLFAPLLGKPEHSEIMTLPECSPYILGKDFAMKEAKEEVVRLGVELSLYVTQSMFLLCDDIRTMLWFCFKLWRGVLLHRAPVLERLLLVIYYVYCNDIKPKNGVYQEDGGNSVHWDLIRTTWKDFADGIIILHRLDIRNRDSSFFDNRVLLSAIGKYKQEVLKKLGDKLRFVENVSKANGFARDSMESNIFGLWKSLFDEEATSKVLRRRILDDLFAPLLGKPVHREIMTLPYCSPYILGQDFAVNEVKEEVVRLGVELSLYVAQSMFLLCDDIRSMLYFCYRLWRDAKRNMTSDIPVVERLIRVIHYIYMKDIKPKNGVYKNDGNYSAQWNLISTTLVNFAAGFRDVNYLVVFLRAGGRCGREFFISSIEEEVKKVEEKLWCVNAVSKANGFARDAMESNILDLWKSIFDTEAKEATQTLKVINNGIIRGLFLPLTNEAPPQ